MTSNAYADTSYDFLATGTYFGNPSVYQLADGKLIVPFDNYNKGIDYYTPGAGSFVQLSINTGNSYDTFKCFDAGSYNNEVVLGGSETSVANANSDGYIVVTDDSGNVLHQVRIEDTSSPTSSTSVSNVFQLTNGNTLVELNNTDSYMLLDSNLQIKETFSFTNYAQIQNLIQNSDGTYTALTSQNTIDYLDSNFNVTGTVGLKLGVNSYFSGISGMTEGNGHLFVIAQDNQYHDVICELSGTGVGSTIVSAYNITSNGSYVTPTHIQYDNGLLYVKPLYGNTTMLSFNPDHGVTANPTGTYKINTESISGSLVADTSTYDPTSTVISTGPGTYQVHSDVNLVGVATGTAYTMNTTGLFHTGSMGTIA